MFKSNLHTHTTHSDGLDTVEQCVQRAIELGFVSIGFSDHSPTQYNLAANIAPKDIGVYIKEVNEIKEKYKDQIEVVLGLEADVEYKFDKKTLGLDFVIGAVHCLQLPDGQFAAVDKSADTLQNIIDTLGGPKKTAEAFYKKVIEVVKTKPDILAHFDLLTKFNGDSSNGHFFDTSGIWYKVLITQVIKELHNTGIIVEINTGAMSRQFRTTPYPSMYILQQLKIWGVPITFSSDAHQAIHIDHGFDTAIKLAKKAGYTSVMQYKDKKFTQVKL